MKVGKRPPRSAARRAAAKPRRYRRWVVKVGSQMVCSGGPLLMRAWVQQLAKLKKDYSIEVIWVTSGAIATAVDRVGFRDPKKTLADKQALSAIGQPLLMDVYNLALRAESLLGAQILLTYDDMTDPNRRANLETTLEKLLSWNVLPILNENDAVATEEIRFGDNDSLSAKVASVMRAERLVILTDVDGLYDKNPTQHQRARLLHEIPKVTEALLETAGKSGSARGTGGMYSKLLAACEATAEGVETWLVKGDLPNVLLLVAEQERVGTVIYASGGKRDD